MDTVWLSLLHSSKYWFLMAFLRIWLINRLLEMSIFKDMNKTSVQITWHIDCNLSQRLCLSTRQSACLQSENMPAAYPITYECLIFALLCLLLWVNIFTFVCSYDQKERGWEVGGISRSLQGCQQQIFSQDLDILWYLVQTSRNID